MRSPEFDKVRDEIIERSIQTLNAGVRRGCLARALLSIAVTTAEEADIDSVAFLEEAINYLRGEGGEHVCH